MKRRKSTVIQILEPAVYWERKLDVNFDTEFIRYKKLCMKKLRKKEKRKLNGIHYITYTAWEQKMLAIISSLNEFELYEYIHFLNGRTKNRNIIFTLTSGYTVPFVVGLFCPYIVTLLTDSILTKDSKMYIAAFFLFFYILYKFLNILLEALDDSLNSSFYNDLKNIVENHYKKLTEGKGPDM